jgi:lysozyme family protein
MSDETFAAAIEVVLAHEGGWQHEPTDPGGETNFGISQVIIDRMGWDADDLGIPDDQWKVPGFMKLLTREKAKELYRLAFWTPGGFEQLTDATVATKIFDFMVNTPEGVAVRLAQLAARVPLVDGRLGPVSSAAINSMAPAAFLNAYRDRMVDYYRAVAAKHPERFRVKLATGKTWEEIWISRAQWGVTS